MEIIYSQTGSNGNCTVIDDGKTLLMIDCGVKIEKVNKSIGYKLSSIDACLITHTHIDHSEYIKKIFERAIPCYMWSKSKEKYPNEHYAKAIEPLKQFEIGTYIINSFPLAHINADRTDCPNLGYIIFSTVTKEKLVWITDTHYIKNNVGVCDTIGIECNYIDVDSYATEIEHIQVSVEKRRLVSHLSLNSCIMWLKKQDLSKCKKIYLLHLTREQGEIKEKLIDEVKKSIQAEEKGIEVIAGGNHG